MLFDQLNIETDQLEDELFRQKQVNVAVLRLDKIHPVISGNKLFKLHYFLEEALLSPQKPILTFGGAYSNHLVATAYACKVSRLKSIGIVRGERPLKLSHSLQSCIDNRMELKFISRESYDQKEDVVHQKKLLDEFGECTVIPEGGYHPLGAKGAAMIMNSISGNSTHICTALGTATTLAGLLLGAKGSQKIIAVPVLKGMHDIHQRISLLTKDKVYSESAEIWDDFHFGGYAKYNVELLSFMNTFYQDHHIPSDFVYTAKMLYAVYDSIRKNRFSPGSKIVCVHTGGLQGNLSLPGGTLIF